ncbi:hypothetical protein L3X07_07820 [Levilactobacillus brevis]|nr:hypothetical protein [Levilactobacillus brevis]
MGLVALIPSVIFGVLIDAFTHWLSWSPLQHYGAQLLATLLSIVILAWGVFFEVNSKTIVMAGEGIAGAVAVATHREFPEPRSGVMAQWLLSRSSWPYLAFTG